MSIPKLGLQIKLSGGPGLWIGRIWEAKGMVRGINDMVAYGLALNCPILSGPQIFAP